MLCFLNLLAAKHSKSIAVKRLAEMHNLAHFPEEKKIL
jgi:hypothetical protein